jgi:hypothetical protein
MTKYHRDDHRTKACRSAAERVLSICNDDHKYVLGIGGGPTRVHQKVINLNISTFDNVDIVGDAHRLPVASGCRLEARAGGTRAQHFVNLNAISEPL